MSLTPPALTTALPILTTERVKLRSLTEDDLPDLFSIFSEPEVMRYWSSPAFASTADAVTLLSHIHQCHQDGTLYQWGVALRSSDRVIGTCTLASIDRAHRRAELGYALGREYWKQGYMTEALPCLLRHAYNYMGLHRIEADVDPRNASSIRILERLGFQLEGRLRERYHVQGEVQDSAFYGLLRSDALFKMDE